MTWTTLPDVLEVYDFGFGKEAPGGNYPTIFIAGFVNSVWGIWRSDDEGQSWTQVGDLPLGSLDPDGIHTPGIFVHRLIQGPHEKRIEQRTVRAA